MRRSLSPRMLGIHFDAKTTLELASDHGFEGVEFLLRDIEEQDEDPEMLATMKADLGILCGTWPLPVDWRGSRERFEADLSRLPHYARLASRLALDRTGTWVLPEINDPALLRGGSPREAAFDWHVERLGAIARVLGDQGQRLGLEAIGVPSSRTGRGPLLFDRIEALDPLVGELRDRGCDVGFVVDSFHLFAAGESPDILLNWDPRAIVTVHLSDVQARAFSEDSPLMDQHRELPTPGGPVANRDLLRHLSSRGYTGPVFAEPVPGGRRLRLEEGDRASHQARVEGAARALRSAWPTIA